MASDEQYVEHKEPSFPFLVQHIIAAFVHAV